MDIIFDKLHKPYSEIQFAFENKKQNISVSFKKKVVLLKIKADGEVSIFSSL